MKKSPETVRQEYERLHGVSEDEASYNGASSSSNADSSSSSSSRRPVVTGNEHTGHMENESEQLSSNPVQCSFIGKAQSDSSDSDSDVDILGPQSPLVTHYRGSPTDSSMSADTHQPQASFSASGDADARHHDHAYPSSTDSYENYSADMFSVRQAPWGRSPHFLPFSDVSDPLADVGSLHSGFVFDGAADSSMTGEPPSLDPGSTSGGYLVPDATDSDSDIEVVRVVPSRRSVTDILGIYL